MQDNPIDTNAPATAPAAPARPSARRLGLLLAILVVVLAFLVGFRPLRDYLKNREFYDADPNLLSKLSVAPLAPEKPPEKTASKDWPQWLGPHRDGTADGTGIVPWPESGPVTRWKVAGGPGHSSFAVVDGRVYTLIQDGDDEAALCLDAGTGKELWRQRWPGKFQSLGGVGPRSTPAVADGRVYAVGAGGTFLCLDAATGAVQWRHDLLTELGASNQEHGVSFSPLVEGDLVFTVPGAPGGAVAAFDRRDGRLVWKAFDDQAGYSSPIMATIAGKRQLVVLSGVAVLGINPLDGTLLWRYPWPTFQGTNAATPIVVGNYVFVSASYSKGCGLLNVEHSPSPPAPLPPGERGEFVAQPVYQHNRMRNHFGTCVLHADHLYGFDENFLVCMELRTGKVRWKERGFNRGSIVLAGNRMIVLGENGVLAIVEPDPEQFKQLATATISQSTCWAMPALADGKLYVHNQESIRCFDLGPAKEP